MKQDTLNKLKTGNVVVYMEFVNEWDEVTERTELARFRNIAWADNFLAGIRLDRDPVVRYVVQEVQ